jgi:hypothetical protein
VRARLAPSAVPSSAETARDAVVRTIIALERSCLDADAALVERSWAELDAAFRAQAELEAELRALCDATPESAPAADAKVEQRIRGVLAYRDEQLRRLRAYHSDVALRLSSIGKVNALSRSIGKRIPGAQLLDAQY